MKLAEGQRLHSDELVTGSLSLGNAFSEQGRWRVKSGKKKNTAGRGGFGRAGLSQCPYDFPNDSPFQFIPIHEVKYLTRQGRQTQ